MLFVAWVAFPVVALALSLGCGLLLELVSGRPLPGLLVAPAGFAVVVVVASLTTTSSSTAQLTTPLVVALTVVGLGLSLGDPRRPRLWPAVAALGVFAVFAAPIVLSGSATFAGYITLDDTATWLALSDNAMAARARSLAARALDLPDRPPRLHERRVPARGVPAARDRPPVDPRRLRLALPAADRVPRLDAVARALRARRAARSQPAAARRRRVPRRAGGAALRLRVLERDQGGDGGPPRRAARGARRGAPG